MKVLESLNKLNITVILRFLLYFFFVSCLMQFTCLEEGSLILSLHNKHNAAIMTLNAQIWLSTSC